MKLIKNNNNNIVFKNYLAAVTQSTKNVDKINILTVCINSTCKLRQKI